MLHHELELVQLHRRQVPLPLLAPHHLVEQLEGRVQVQPDLLQLLKGLDVVVLLAPRLGKLVLLAGPEDLVGVVVGDGGGGLQAPEDGAGPVLPLLAPKAVDGLADGEAGA